MFRYQEVEAWDFSLLIILLLPAGIVFTIKTKIFYQSVCSPDMLKSTKQQNNKNGKDEKKAVFLLYRP